ncbi:metallo ase [Fusarium beomiforme]|uniref:Metallo ase n=1 Tax=Fusarium beomiforme TaxID=44412 RepID=A0A9P5A8Q9_9HYPO|nr:metallo ase [Fusarium beomiforme]
MDSNSLPQHLPVLIPADRILPTMKRIVEKYNDVRERIIQNVDVQSASFDNVIQPLVNMDNQTQGDIAVIAMLRYASPDRASCQASEEACTLINEDLAAFTARADFWCLLKAAKERSEGASLNFEAQKYLDKLFLEFKQFGHDTLQPDQIQEYLERRNRIDKMRRQYNQRLREDTGGLWLSLDELTDVPQHDLNRFIKHPEKDEMRFVRFSAADTLAVYRSASKSATRKKMYICDANNLSQNAELFRDIVVQRDLNARLLGYESHAAYRLRKRLMKSPAQVEGLLNDLEDKLLAQGQQDMKYLVELKKEVTRENPDDSDGDVDAIFPWDYWYYAHVAQQRQHVNQQRLAEYFPLQHVIAVMLEMFSEFLELRFSPISIEQLEGSTWHPDVEAWAVWDDREESKGEFIGYLYMDLLARDNKYKGNQNVNLQCGYLREDGTRVYPATILIQIVSLFHELGHGIHDLVARTNCVTFHGHRSPPDFAEALSVMLEKWCWMEPELKRLALHYTSFDPQLKEKWLREHPGEDLPPARIPNDMIERLAQGRKMTRSLWYLRQMVYARFDMAVHNPKSHDELLDMDFTKIFHELMEKLWIVRAPEPEDQGYPHADLGHLVSGYDAGYYSYLSAHVFAAELFQSTFLRDPRSVSAWERYRKGILEFGGSRDELELLQEYLGHTPTAEALLRNILQ